MNGRFCQLKNFSATLGLPAASVLSLVDHVGACDAAQKVVHDHPLVVPGNQAPGLLEQCRAGEAQL